MSLRLSTVILPYRRWQEGGRAAWTRAEQLGFHTAYTYDHLSWRTFRDGPWFGAVPTLTAAATVTDRLRLGTLVTSPNFRHPVTLAKELISLDDISGGRVSSRHRGGRLGLRRHGARAAGAMDPRCERADRFAEVRPARVDRLLEPDDAWRGVPGRLPATRPTKARNIPLAVCSAPGCRSRWPRPARAGCGSPPGTGRRG
ncbi:Alkanesulfonate monooxygenase SsuD/methylene tetrahydromethanopterin reductase-like flavin-dependent oxidoreductase (Luciferase family) OS=Streptomyces violarus OX=67380 GN=FHS41_004253 PE=4 SV=1 [Streptomyces violarus]